METIDFAAVAVKAYSAFAFAFASYGATGLENCYLGSFYLLWKE